MCLSSGWYRHGLASCGNQSSCLTLTLPLGPGVNETEAVSGLCLGQLDPHVCVK